MIEKKWLTFTLWPKRRLENINLTTGPKSPDMMLSYVLGGLFWNKSRSVLGGQGRQARIHDYWGGHIRYTGNNMKGAKLQNNLGEGAVPTLKSTPVIRNESPRRPNLKLPHWTQLNCPLRGPAQGDQTKSLKQIFLSLVAQNRQKLHFILNHNHRLK